MRNNWTGVLIGFLAGGWAATLLLVFLPGVDLVGGTAQADDGDVLPLPPLPLPGAGNGGAQPGAQPGALPGGGNLPPTSPLGRGLPNPGGGTSDSNNRAIALSASIGSGESVVYYFDTISQRLLVFQYKGSVSGNRPLRPSDRGGLRLLAARQFDYDLKLSAYRDLSESRRDELRELFESQNGPGGNK